MQNKKPDPVIIEKDGRKYKEVPVKSALPLWAAVRCALITRASILPRNM